MKTISRNRKTENSQIGSYDVNFAPQSTGNSHIQRNLYPELEWKIFGIFRKHFFYSEPY